MGLFWGIRLGFDPIWGVRTWIWPYFGGSGAESEGLDLDLNPFWGGAELGLGVLVWIWAYLEGPAWIWPYFGDTDLDLALFWGGPGLDLGPWIWAHLEGLGGGLEKFDSRSEKNFNPPLLQPQKNSTPLSQPAKNAMDENNFNLPPSFDGNQLKKSELNFGTHLSHHFCCTIRPLLHVLLITCVCKK